PPPPGGRGSARAARAPRAAPRPGSGAFRPRASPRPRAPRSPRWPSLRAARAGRARAARAACRRAAGASSGREVRGDLPAQEGDAVAQVGHALLDRLALAVLDADPALEA